MIEGVVTKQLTRHHDERGYFQEIIRKTDPFFDEFGQWSMSVMYTDVIKAWHCHNIQADYWFVPVGVIKAALYDDRANSSTYKEVNEFILKDDSGVLYIPPGVAHGCKVLQSPATLMYITSEVYNPDDERRIRHDALAGYNWLERTEIK